MKLFLISLFLLLTSVSAEDCSTALYLSDQPVSLKGGWLFLRGDNPEWKRPELDDSGWQRKSLPDQGKDKSAQSYGYYWYRCHIFLQEGDTPYSLGINLGNLRDIDEVYFNGNLIGNNGSMIPRIEVDTEKIRIYSIPDNYVVPGKNVIAVRIYSTTTNFGIRSIPLIGMEEKLLASQTRAESFSIIAGFVFILMGIFFIFSSIVKSNNQSNLFFSLFSIFLGLYTILRSSFRYEIFNNFAFSYSTELFLLLMLPVLFLNFFVQFLNLKRKLYTYVYDFIQISLGIYAFFVNTPLKWIQIIDLNIYLLIIPVTTVLYISFKHYKYNVKKMRFILIGIIGLFPCVVSDALRALELIRAPQTIHFGFLFFLINISIQLSEELVENYKNYIKQETDLVKMEKLKTNFIFNISIEFRSYLDKAQEIIKNLLNNDYTEPEILEKLNQLESVMSLSKAMIHDAIVLNSVENQKYEIFTERISLREFLTEIISIIELRHNQKRENYQLLLGNSNIDVYLNRELTFLVFYHLIENIYLYTPKDSGYTIECRLEGNKLSVKITDFGTGIPQEQKSDIFKKFVRGSNAISQKTHGAGIGLTIVQTICKAFGGDISIETNPTGTTVFFYFPIS